MKLMLTLKEASSATGLSVEALRLAITQSYDEISSHRNVTRTRLPRLNAKQPTGSSGYRILTSDLEAWLRTLPDA